MRGLSGVFIFRVSESRWENALLCQSAQGWLRLHGAESPNSKHTQSLLAHRQQSFYCQAETKLEFNPEDFQHMFGLIYYYNTQCYYYQLYVTRDEMLGRRFLLLNVIWGKGSMPIGAGIVIPEEGPVYLRLTTKKERHSLLVYGWRVL